MFDNIIGQKPVVTSLVKSLDDSSLPRAMLFFGPQYAGKLSAALELGRIITCEERKGEWQCACAACRKQRLLLHPDVLLLGARDFDAEIAASADVLARTNKQSARFLFIRACRKLSRRFDPVLWDGDDSKIRQYASTISELEELLDALGRTGIDRKSVV
jgi:DNA polymerase III delta prime subunit